MPGMEKYDPGLVVIAQAQAARDAGDKQGAHELFVKGIEELLKLTREDTDERIKALVKKHVVRFMAEAEELLGIVPPSPTASRPASATKTSLKRAEMLERNGREEQRKLSWQKAWKLYAEAAETYQKYGAEVRPVTRSDRTAISEYMDLGIEEATTENSRSMHIVPRRWRGMKSLPSRLQPRRSRWLKRPST